MPFVTRSRRPTLLAALILAALLAAPVAAAEPPVLVGAGDIVDCANPAPAIATAALIATRYPGAAVFTAGDNVYPAGTAAAFADCYAPAWGGLLPRTRAAAGNHDWLVAGARPYRAWFGSRSLNAAGRTWYAYSLGTWRVIVLDSECAKVGGCGPASRQGRWLARELAAHPAACTLAITHRPLFSSGVHGSQAGPRPLVSRLVAAGVDVLVSGHDHDYERFTRQTAGGTATSRGIRQFVVGTGGGPLRTFRSIHRHSATRIAGRYGVLALTLADGSYGWEFVTTAGGAVLDHGTTACH